MKYKLYLWFLPLILANLFCSFSAPTPAAAPTPDIAIIVNATLTAVAISQPSQTPTSLPTATLPPATKNPKEGTVSGNTLLFPADKLPALRIAFFNVDGSLFGYTDTIAGQNNYSMNLPAGTYTVVAYALGGAGFTVGTAGGYSQAVPCGLDASCSDHSLIKITVKSGETLTGINPNDYYAPANIFPPMPK